MNVNFFYQIVQNIVNKNQNGYIPPAQFNLFANQAQTSFLDYLLGDFQSYQYGRPLSKVQWGMNEITRQRLTPLIGPVVTLTPDNTGFVAYPSDFQQVDAMYQTNKDRIRYVPQHKLYSYLQSQIDPIATNPIFTIESGGFRFYPNTTDTQVASPAALLSYVKTPPTIVWAYTTDSNGRPVYSPGTSVDPVFYDTDNMELISRVLQFVGINLQAQEIEQYATMIKNQGD